MHLTLREWRISAMTEESRTLWERFFAEFILSEAEGLRMTEREEIASLPWSRYEQEERLLYSTNGSSQRHVIIASQLPKL